MKGNEFKKLIILILLVILSTPAECSDTLSLFGPNVNYLLIEPGMGFKLSIVDGVKDGCWENSKSAMNAVALKIK